MTRSGNSWVGCLRALAMASGRSHAAARGVFGARTFSFSPQASEEKPAYLIMGANGGMGSSLAEKLLLDGSRVALCCRDEAKTAAVTTGSFVIVFLTEGGFQNNTNALILSPAGVDEGCDNG